MSSKRRNSELAQLARTYRVPASDTDLAINSFLHALDCPRSLTVWLLYSNNEHQQLVDLDIDPHHYNDAFQFRDAYTATCLLSKSDFFKLEVSKKDAAFSKFFKYEELCKQTNNRFRNLSFDSLYTGANVWLLSATTRKIAQILGDYCPEELVDEAYWGPGVTTLLKGSEVSAVNKFHSENGITRDLYSLVGSVFSSAYPLWSAHLTQKYSESWANFQVGNKIVTVPKNSKTDRVIAVEPGINLWFQKGIGTMIRRRIRRWGVDLNSQKRNQQLAKKSSKDATLATVDFSSASDSIARELVREVLPPDWFNLLDLSRSKLGTHNKDLIRWEKFSSMGNGFTFELESLIFFAAALSVCEYLKQPIGEVSVFGDDVIIPTACYELFSSFSEFLGFRVNKDKSFSNSYFRESCGSHYFDGIDVKPIFLKERLRNVKAIYKLANSIRWLGHRRNSYCGCDRRLRSTWYRLLERIPKPLRFRIPVITARLWLTPDHELNDVSIGDTGLISNFDEAMPTRARDGIEGYYFSCLLERGVTRESESLAVLLARLSRQSVQAYKNTYTLRGQTKFSVKRVLVPTWYNLGSWI